MKFFLFLVLIFFALAGASLPMPGGAVDGGGGKAVVCRSDKGVIISSEILDFYEGRVLFDRHIPSSSIPHKEQVHSAVQKLSQNDWSVFFDYYLSKIYENWKLMPEGTHIEPIDDAHEILWPSHCKLEQAVHFYNPEKIFVSSDIWNILDETNKAGLIFHELVYWLERDFGAKNSRRSRKITAYAFDPSTEWTDPLAGVPSKALICVANTNTYGPTAKSVPLSYFRAFTIGNQLRFQFLVLGGQFAVTKSWVEFDAKTFKLTKSPLILKGDTSVGENESVYSRVTSSFEKDHLILEKRKEAIYDYQTGQQIPGFHMVNYYLSGRSSWSLNYSYSPALINCSVEIPSMSTD